MMDYDNEGPIEIDGHIRRVDVAARACGTLAIALFLAWLLYPGMIRDVPEYHGNDGPPEWAMARLRAKAEREHAEWENAHQGPPSPMPVAWDTEGRLAVADYQNNRILIYSRPADAGATAGPTLTPTPDKE